MPTTFTTNFIDNNNEVVHADHVKQFATPVNNLENGSALYRPDTGSANIYRLNYASGNIIAGPTPEIGRRINFKAKTANTSASSVVITGVSGELTPIPLTKSGGEPLEAGDIKEHQAVSAIYVEDQGIGRFELLGARPETNAITGSVLYTYASSPEDYLEANGQIVNQADFPGLFAKLGLIPNVNSDSSSWAKLSPGTNVNHDFQDVEYHQGTFVAIGLYNTGWVSPDGSIWSYATLPNGNAYGLTYSQGIFLAVGSNGEFWTSPDGWSWEYHTGPNTVDSLMDVTHGNSRFIAVGPNGTVWSSGNGIKWTKRTGPNTSDYLRSVAYGNGVYVAVGNSLAIWTSPNGTTWTKWTPPYGIGGSFNSVVFAAGVFVAVGPSGNVWTSPDGYTWTVRPGPNTADNLKDVTYGNDRFAVVGWGGVIWTSPDGYSWTKQAGPNTSDNLDGVTYGNGIFIAVGFNGVIWQSPMTYSYDTQTQFALPSIPSLTDGSKAWLRT